MGQEMTLGLKIKDARENKRLTQKELADILGLKSDKVISSWERDRTKPDYDSIVKICQILDVSLNYLFGSNSEDYYDSISPNESALIEDFRLLDEIGQSVVLYNLNAQKKRCLEKNIKIDDDFTFKSKDHPVKNLFLDKTNIQYDSMKAKTKDLAKLKKRSYLSYENIFMILGIQGYNGKICIADLIKIMHQIKVPSEELYNDIEILLNNSQY